METRQLLEIQKKNQIPRMNITYFWYLRKSWKTMESVIFRISLWKQSIQWTFNLLGEILKKNRNRKKYFHSLKEHPKLSKIAMFSCKML